MPPYQLTHRMTALVADIAERLGAWKAANRCTSFPGFVGLTLTGQRSDVGRNAGTNVA
ncbi:hypothetical protein [Luteimonas sp. A478]